MHLATIHQVSAGEGVGSAGAQVRGCGENKANSSLARQAGLGAGEQLSLKGTHIAVL